MTTFDANGFRFTVTTLDAELDRTLADRLVDLRRDDDGADVHRFEVTPTADVSELGSRRHDVTLDGRLVYPALIDGALLSHLLIEVNRHVAAACTGRGTIPLHAATAAGPGGCVVVAGGPEAGKTTLATALALSGPGWSFVADEVSELDPETLTASPYGKPIALRPASIRVLGADRLGLDGPPSRFEHDERFVPPSTLHQAPTIDAAVAMVVFPRFDSTARDGAGRPAAAVTPVRPGQALARLAGLTLADGALDRRAFRALERLVRAVPAYDVVHGDAWEAARAVRSLPA